MMASVTQLADHPAALLRAALSYAERGIPVFPVWGVDGRGVCGCTKGKTCKQPGKHPITRNGFKDATVTEKAIRQWWRAHPEANIGLALGDAGLVAVDIDPRNDGESTLFQLEQEYGDLPPTYTVETGGGGQHYYFRLPDGDQRWRCAFPGQGVDLKTTGGYVVAPPSRHYSGQRYVVSSTAPQEIADAPQWVIDYCLRRSKAPTGLEEVTDPALSIMGAAFVASAWVERSMGADRIAVLCPWEDEHTAGERGDTSTVVFSSTAKGGVGWFHCSHSHCAHRTQADVWGAIPETVRKIISKRFRLADGWLPPGSGAGVIPLSPGAPAAAVAAVEKAAATPEVEAKAVPWEHILRYDSKGRLTTDPGNVCLILMYHPEWKGALVLDKLKGTLVWKRRPPLAGHFGVEVGDQWGEHTWLLIAQWFARDQHCKVGRENISAGVSLAAERTGMDPVAEYLNNLAWDNLPRLDTWLSDYLGTPDTPWSRLVGRKWMISAAARALRPGCQVDHTLILEGGQGSGKSSALRCLARKPEWFLDNIPNLQDKDAQIAITAHWIVEFQELESFSHVDVKRLKGWLTMRFDQYRPPYARQNIQRSRRCVFAGSTNEVGYLHDSTGARRFWPVEVGVVDLDGLEAAADQLWAEATAAFVAGERWHLEGAEVQLAKQEQASRTTSDPWEAVLMAGLAARGQLWTTIGEALRICAVSSDRWDPVAARRLNGVLASQGWTRHALDIGKMTYEVWTAPGGGEEALSQARRGLKGDR